MLIGRLNLLRSLNLVISQVNMNVFTQKLNPITGKCDWEVQNQNYDFHQEVARSAFADMLHDTERNQKYEQALKVAIDHMHANGKKANVLDIGTGTGLLSMMAVRNGADSVIACEAFEPMSKCAVKIIESNGFGGKIKVIPKSSTKLTVGENCDLESRANILVTEVFDTELIGEGALGTFSHAHKVLLEKDCIVIPHSATVYAQIVESPLVHQWNKLNDVYNDEGEILLRVPTSMKNCKGAAAVHDLQLSEIDLNFVKFIVEPQKVFRFDWSGKTPFIFERTNISTLKSRCNGSAQAVFMWWDLNMDIDNKIILSCAPSWAHPDAKSLQPNRIPWRDHWMQAVYYFPKEIPVKENEEIHLLSCHDEYSLWFNLKKDLKITETDYYSPLCDCNLHISYSRTRIGQLNDKVQTKKYLKLLEKQVNNESVVLILSHGFYLGLGALKYGAKKVICFEENRLSGNIMRDFVSFNKLDNAYVLDNIENIPEVLGGDQINFVLGEPYFISSIVPWHNLLFAYLLNEFRTFLSDDVKLFPKSAVIKTVAVEFKDLQKIRTPLGICEGFDMGHFDEIIKASCQISDENVEAQPLWEYPGVAASEPFTISTIDLEKCNSLIVVDQLGNYHLKERGKCNGLVFWVDWDLDGTGKHVISTGPTRPIVPGEKINWYMHIRQGVYLFSPDPNTDVIKYRFKFDPSSGHISVELLT